MSVFKQIEGHYSNHVGGAWTHPLTGAVYFLVTYRQNSQGAYWLQVWEDKLPYGDPVVIRQWQTGTPEAGPGPWGYGTCTWAPDGSLYIIAPGGVNDTSIVGAAIHIEPNLFPPIPLGAGAVAGPAGPQGPQGPKGDTGAQGPAGAPGSVEGSLSIRYIEALERLCAFFGL